MLKNNIINIIIFLVLNLYMNKVRLLKSNKFIISSIITSLAVIFIFNSGFINIIKPGFYFEKYNTGDKAREEYYEKIDYNAKYRKIRDKLYFEYKHKPKNKDNDQKYYEELNQIHSKIITQQDKENIIKLRQEKQYKKDAMTELLKLHPIGSDVNDLVKTLEKAGAVKYIANVSQKYKNNPRLLKFIRFKYKNITLSSIYYKKWRMSVEFDKFKNIKYISIIDEQRK